MDLHHAGVAQKFIHFNALWTGALLYWSIKFPSSHYSDCLKWIFSLRHLRMVTTELWHKIYPIFFNIFRGGDHWWSLCPFIVLWWCLSLFQNTNATQNSSLSSLLYCCRLVSTFWGFYHWFLKFNSKFDVFSLLVFEIHPKIQIEQVRRLNIHSGKSSLLTNCWQLQLTSYCAYIPVPFFLFDRNSLRPFWLCHEFINGCIFTSLPKYRTISWSFLLGPI